MKQLFSLLMVVFCVYMAAAQKDPSQIADKKLDEVFGGLNKESSDCTKIGILVLSLNCTYIHKHLQSGSVNQYV